MLKLLKKLASIKLFVFSLLVLSIISFFHYQSPDISNSIDGSWPLTLSALRHSSQNLGVNIYYTYGPLFERIPVYPVDGDSIKVFFIGLLFFIALTAGMVYCLNRLLKLVPTKNSKLVAQTAAVFLGFLVLSPSSIDSLFFVCLVCAFLVSRRETSSLRILLAISSVLLFSLYKVSFTITFLLLLPFALAPNKLIIPVTKKRFLLLLTALVLYVLSFSLVSWSSPTGFFRYLYIGLVNSSSYPEFMSLTYSQNIYIVVVYTALLAAALILSFIALLKKLKEKDFSHNLVLEYFYQMIIVFTGCFLAYKQAVVRSDSHLLTFIPMVPVLLLVVMTFGLRLVGVENNKHMHLSIKLSFIVGSIVSATIFQTIYPNKSPLGYFFDKMSMSYSSVVNNPLNYSSYKDKISATKEAVASDYPGTTKLQEFISKNGYSGKPIIFFGNTTSLAATFKRNTVTYLPFVQNYAAFPPQLFDTSYIDKVRNNPGSLIFLEENEASINERIPSHELNNFFKYLSYNYTPIYQDSEKRYYLLKKVSDKMESCTVISTISSTKDKPIIVPSLNIKHDDYVKMKVNLKDEFDENLLSLFIKRPVYSVNFYSSEGGKLTRRTTPSTLSHGVSIYPLFLSYTDTIKDTQFKLSYATVSGGLHKASGLDITFENCSFE